MTLLATIAILWLLAGVVAAVLFGAMVRAGGSDDPRRERQAMSDKRLEELEHLHSYEISECCREIRWLRAIKQTDDLRLANMVNDLLVLRAALKEKP